MVCTSQRLARCDSNPVWCGRRGGLIVYRARVPAGELVEGALLDLGHPVHDAATVHINRHTSCFILS